MALVLFSRRHQPSTLRFLPAYPTPHTAQQATPEQIAAVLTQAGHPMPEQVAAKIFQTLQQAHVSAAEVTTRTTSRLRLSLVRHLLPVLEEIASYEKDSTGLFLKHADRQISRSLPRAGKRLAPRLLAERGEDRHRYPTAASLQALAGTSPVPDVWGK